MNRLPSQSSGDLSGASGSLSGASGSSISSPSRQSTSGLSVADLLQSPTEKSSQPPKVIPNTNKNANANINTNAKVPIPRQRNIAVPRYSRRVPRACESCRLRKSKCSGETPVCKLCRDSKTACVYPLAIREKTSRTISALSRRLHECEELLREVEIFVPKQIAQKIQALLAQENEFSLRSLGEEPNQDYFSGDSWNESLEIVDKVNEDLHTTDISLGDGVHHQMLKYNLDSTSIEKSRRPPLYPKGPHSQSFSGQKYPVPQ